MLTNITIEEATRILETQVTVSRTEEVSLTESLDCVLAEEIVSGMDLPPFPRSPLDGYAVRSEDIQSASEENSVTLKIIDDIRAGHVSLVDVGPGQAVRLMTGARIPSGADAVIKYEDTLFTEETVSFFSPVRAGENLVLQGEDVGKGDTVLMPGSVIGPAEIGILAALGRPSVHVFAKPRVALLATGDELTDIEQELQDGQIHNSNSYMIAAQLRRLGISPEILGFCRDEVHEAVDCLSPSLERTDFIITTGGASVGNADIIKEVFEELGAEILFWKVKVKPGSPLVVARLGDKLLIGLSGNPAAAFISFEQFARPVLRKAMGKNNNKFMKVKTTLESDFSRISGQNRYVRAYTYKKDDEYFTILPDKHSSGVLSSLSGKNSMFFVPGGEGPYHAGDQISVELLDCIEVEA